MKFVTHCLDTFTGHHATNPTHNQQNNVVQHLGIGLVNRRHALDRLGHKSHRVKHKSNNPCEDHSDNDDNDSPNSDLDFFTCQKAVEFVVVQLASPKQGRQDNPNIVE